METKRVDTSEGYMRGSRDITLTRVLLRKILDDLKVPRVCFIMN